MGLQLARRLVSRSNTRAQRPARTMSRLQRGGETTSSKPVQFAFTFIGGGALTYMAWDHLDGISRGLIFMFAIIAAAAIQQGTWTVNHRELRHQHSRQRQDTYREAYEWLAGVEAQELERRGSKRA